MLNVINNLDTNFKFSSELESNDGLNFLDVTTFKDNGNLLIKWFRKSTSTLTFQQWNSNCPYKYNVQIIGTMIKRLKSICSNQTLFREDLESLKQSFRYSGYPEKIIQKYLKQANDCTITTSQNVQKKSYILEYNIFLRFHYS